jgi:hypothetical protein
MEKKDVDLWWDAIQKTVESMREMLEALDEEEERG